MRHAVRRRVVSTGYIVLLGAILALGLIPACDKQIPGPVSPPIQDNVPPTPTDLRATIGDRTVYLSWNISDTSNVLFYRVYFSDSSGSNYEVLDEVEGTSAEALNLQNGQRYYFRVAAVNLTSFEGYPSLAVSAIPDLYAVIINAGQDFTNNQNITLTLVAPTDTRHMQIADNSNFSGAAWEAFAPSRSWLMPPGDGPFTIFARFRDRNDNVTSNYFSDQITLDTEAYIDSVRFTPVGPPLSTGDQIHFKLFCGESDGQTNIVIGTGLADIQLYDDGSRGDLIAGDGVYEVDFEVGRNLDFENAPVVGNLIDRAGNRATQSLCRDNVTVRRAPDPVSIYGITPENGRYDRLVINWSASTAPDFAQYRVYRSIAAGVDSSDFLVRSLSAAGITSLTDTGLVQNTAYYYRVYVLDNTGLWAGSGEAQASTQPNNPPDAVTVFPIVAVPGTHNRLDITWSVCGDQDFLRYELYRSNDDSVDISDILAFASQSDESFTDNDLSANTSYYYRVRCIDRADNSSWSNMVAGRTGIDEPPDPALMVPLMPEPDYYQDISLSWSQPQTDDFRDYRIYTWHGDTGRNDSLLIGAISAQSTTTFAHRPSMPTGIDTVNYWYIVHTYDMGGNSAASNAVRAHLSDITPGQVSGTVIPDSNFLMVSWVPTEIPDFGSYRVLRDTLGTPNQAVVVHLNSSQAANAYIDRNTVQGRTYYYWLDVYDRRGHSSRTFLGSSRW